MQIESLGKIGGNCARKRAARSVRVGIVDPLAAEPFVGTVCIKKIVGIVYAVPPFSKTAQP